MGILYLSTGKVSRSLPTGVSGEGNFVSTTERQQTHQLEPPVLRNELKTTVHSVFLLFNLDTINYSIFWTSLQSDQTDLVLSHSISLKTKETPLFFETWNLPKNFGKIFFKPQVKCASRTVDSAWF